jgi:hypothetical protein
MFREVYDYVCVVMYFWEVTAVFVSNTKVYGLSNLGVANLDR